ncbi:MAG: aminotransferase class I/II-fold pyridoxal phosphate-dependent enzyme [Candidatus Zixiibacteriota bacterium]
MEDSLHSNAVEQFYLKHGFATRALHAGEHIAGSHSNAHTLPIYQTSTFVFDSAEQGKKLFAAEDNGFIYTRLGNPTTLTAEAKLNALEGCGAKLVDPDNVRISSLLFTSGMAAVSGILLALLDKGDTLIRGDVVYGCTDSLLTHVLPKFGVNTIPVDTSDLAKFTAVMKANPSAKGVYFETPTNPTMSITDIREISRIAKSINPNCLIIVDNTYATPYLQRPLELGADVVTHSTTKYISGHGTVIGGAVITNHPEFKDKLYGIMKDVGSCPSPFDSWLVYLGLKTLAIRMERHCSSAMKVAQYLEKHPLIERVFYPGLPSHPHYALAKSQMSGFGGVLAFEMKDGYECACRLMDNIKIFTLAVSLGAVDSLIQHPASMTHSGIDPEIRRRIGITDGLVRISVGLEDPEDLIAALDAGLAVAANRNATSTHSVR